VSFNFVADAMLQLSDADRRLSISDNLFRLYPLSKGLGTSTGGILQVAQKVSGQNYIISI